VLTIRELATVQAALQYWKEEMCPHGANAMRPYLEPRQVEPLTATEIEELRQQFDPGTVRYAIYAPDAKRLAGTDLHITAERAKRAAGAGVHVATVLLPGT